MVGVFFVELVAGRKSRVCCVFLIRILDAENSNNSNH